MHTVGKVTEVGDGIRGKGSMGVKATVEGGGARAFGRRYFLFEKEKEENLSEERDSLLWSRGTEEGAAATRTWTSPSCWWLFPTGSREKPAEVQPQCC
jgi:hypothetical protein